MDPIQLFADWYKAELQVSTALVPSACCLSTIGLDGYPNARFVALKEVLDGQFVITGSLNSRKGLEIKANNQVALTFWWEQTGRQVRVQGDASLISAELAAHYFRQREREAQIVSHVSRQGQQMQGLDILEEAYQAFQEEHSTADLEIPEDWGGYSITPTRIEFMSFKQTRFHERVLYQLENGNWTKQQLQP